MEADAAPYAIELTRAVKRPVQVILSQAESQNHDRPAPGALARMTALPGAGGITAPGPCESQPPRNGRGVGSAYRHGTEPKLDPSPPYAIPNVSVDAVPVELPFTPGYMRGSPQRELSFFAESFIDELAHAAGMEPLTLRMALLGQDGRLARCFQAASRRAQWDGGTSGSTMGIAGASAYGSSIALVANGSIGPDQRVKVERLVAAVDCGRVINPSLAGSRWKAA